MVILQNTIGICKKLVWGGFTGAQYYLRLIKNIVSGDLIRHPVSES